LSSGGSGAARFQGTWRFPRSPDLPSLSTPTPSRSGKSPPDKVVREAEVRPARCFQEKKYSLSLHRGMNLKQANDFLEEGLRQSQVEEWGFKEASRILWLMLLVRVPMVQGVYRVEESILASMDAVR
jgi:hypothetical protein